MTNLLPSTERAYKDKIKELTEEKKMIYAAALRRVTAIINLSSLSEAQKTELLSVIWEE
jgi:uncharacterized protein YydD (DUF2326 family)